MTNLNEVKRYLDEIGCDYSANEPMKLHTSFKIGGPADLFIRPAGVDMLRSAMLKCLECELPVHVVGGGNNLLVSDLGVVGAVIYTGGLSDVTYNGGGTILCSAGAKLSRICNTALENGLSGMEFAWGIPGTAGGAVYMNAGAYGGEMKNVISMCTHIDRDGSMVTLDRDEMELDYRKSIYQSNDGIILSVKINLEFGDPNEIRAKMDDFIARRKDKQPLEYPSAGSTFKRPDGYFAGTLIQDCGLKGVSVGGAMVSEKHAGFIINTGNATCDDVLKLIDLVKEKVLSRYGVELECEVKMLK